MNPRNGCLMPLAAVLLLGATVGSRADNPDLSSKPILPDDMKAAAQEAAEHYGRKEYDEAAGCYQRIIDKYPKSLYGWSNLGVVRYQQKHFDESKVALLQALQLSPNDVFSLRSLGITCYQLKQYDDAIGIFQHALEIEPKDLWSLDYLGCSYAQKGETQKAEEELKKAMDIDPTFGEACYNYSVLLADAKPPDLIQAKKYYQLASELGIRKDPRMEGVLSSNSDGE